MRACFSRGTLPQMILDLDGRLSQVNDAFCDLVRRPRHEVQGRFLADVWDPASAGLADGHRQALLAGDDDAATWEQEIRHPDGASLPVVVHASVLRTVEDELVGLVGVVEDLSALRAIEAALLRSQALFGALLRSATDWVVVADERGVIRYASPSTATLFGYDTQEVLGTVGWDLVHPDDLDGLQKAFARIVAEGGTTETMLVRALHRGGEWRWVEEVFTNLLDDPSVAGIVCSGRDVTAKVEADEAVRASEALYRGIADSAQEGIWLLDFAGRTLYANRKLADILGLPAAVVARSSVRDLFDGTDAGLLSARLRRGVEPGEQDFELSYSHPDGSSRVLHFRVNPEVEQVASGSLSVVSDVTEARRTDDALRRRSLHDDLTGLPNRGLFLDRVTQALARADRREFNRVAVLFLDLDEFQLVNSSLGHAAGDELLVAVAERLTEAVGSGHTLARFAGDQFVVLAEDIEEPDVRALAEQVLAALRAPFDFSGKRVYVTGAIGSSVSPATDADELLRFANAALSQAKANGGGSISAFDPGIASEAADRLSLGNDLREALVSDALELHYQPIVDLSSGEILAVEALARWNHATRGAVPPSLFVPLAEAIGLGPSLDRWALERACRDSARLRRLLGTSVRVAVNVSARHFTDDQLVDTVLSTLRRGRMPGRTLVLELTETALMGDVAHARDVLHRLAAHGVTASLDDFGTGYNSLRQLSQLPVATVKIDCLFVENITHDPDALALTASIIEMARALRLKTVAEGVETVQQQSILSRLGCDMGQGYLWSPAVSVDDLAATVSTLPHGSFVSLTTQSLGAAESVTAEHGLALLVRLHREGASLATIAAALNNEGFRTPKGLRWHRSTVGTVLTNSL